MQFSDLFVLRDSRAMPAVLIFKVKLSIVVLFYVLPVLKKFQQKCQIANIACDIRKRGKTASIC